MYRNQIFSKVNTPGQLSPIVDFSSAKSLVLENVMLSVVNFKILRIYVNKIEHFWTFLIFYSNLRMLKLDPDFGT